MNPLTIAELRAAINGLSDDERKAALHLLASISICNETVHKRLSDAVDTVYLGRVEASLRTDRNGGAR